jgi:lysophospholipase L1-like esterase
VTLRLALLGDSIAFGQGATRPRDRLAPRLERGLASAGFEVSTRVLAVPGAASSGLAPQVDRALSWPPDVTVVVVGANDLTNRVRPAAAARSLGDAVTRLRAAGAEVVVAPAPDLSVVPHVPEPLRGVVRDASAALREAQVRAVSAAGGRVADGQASAETSFATDPALFSADRFHPSSAGYAVIAAAVLPAVLAAAWHRFPLQPPGNRGP